MTSGGGAQCSGPIQGVELTYGCLKGPDGVPKELFIVLDLYSQGSIARSYKMFDRPLPIS